MHNLLVHSLTEGYLDWFFVFKIIIIISNAVMNIFVNNFDAKNDIQNI